MISLYYRKGFLSTFRRFFSVSSSTKLSRDLFRRHGYKMALVNPLRSDGFMFESSKLIKSSIPPVLSPFVDTLARLRRETEEHLKVGAIEYDKDVQSSINAYCSGIGFEVDHCETQKERDFFFTVAEEDLAASTQKNLNDVWIYEQLRCAEEFENLLSQRYSAARRFSLEGMESAVPCLNAIVDSFSAYSIAEESGIKPIVVFGCLHRGRLNFVANVLNIPLDELLSVWDAAKGPSFDDMTAPHVGHRYLSSDVFMVPIPAHLEAMTPSILGKARAYITERSGGEFEGEKWQKAARSVLPLSVHGDASFCGEGVIQETLQLATCTQYEAGGTIHLILNNQIGYTSETSKLRSSNSKLTQATDVSRSIGAPVLHVNAAMPRIVVEAAKLAVRYRQQFRKDIVIDLWGWRKHGHNELDDATMTNVSMYRKIQKHASITDIFKTTLEKDKDKTISTKLEEVSTRLAGKFRSAVVEKESVPTMHISTQWPGMKSRPQETSVSKEVLNGAIQYLTKVPAGFQLHPRVQRNIESRAEALGFIDGGKIDWPTAELLALSTLSIEGIRCRLSGEDVERGTFAQRHAVWYDVHTGRKHSSLPPSVEICNSPLSELGVLGFEFGWSTIDPMSLVLWEAQFGDFVNNAQVIIDTLISSSYEKWWMQSGLVLLLPHGYDGLGPEHSSSRVERWLQMLSSSMIDEKHSSGDPHKLYKASNIIIASPTDPSNYFHLLRRQLAWPFRRPLIVLSPKRTLRNAAATSPLSNFISHGTQSMFRCVLDDPFMENNAHRQEVSCLIVCSGEIYYDLCVFYEEKGLDRQHIAIIRLEQLAPFPAKELSCVLKMYPRLKAVSWVQEEPCNGGALNFVRYHIVDKQEVPQLNGVPFTSISRPEAAAPAWGDPLKHASSQQNILNEVLDWSTNVKKDIATVEINDISQ